MYELTSTCPQKNVWLTTFLSCIKPWYQRIYYNIDDGDQFTLSFYIWKIKTFLLAPLAPGIVYNFVNSFTIVYVWFMQFQIKLYLHLPY